MTDIIDKAKVLDAEPVGIVTSSQVRQFLSFSINSGGKGKEKEPIERIAETIRKTMELGQIVPISWFKLNTGPVLQSLIDRGSLRKTQTSLKKLIKND